MSDVPTIDSVEVDMNQKQYFIGGNLDIRLPSMNCNDFDLSTKTVQKCQLYPTTKVRLRTNLLNAAPFCIFRTLLTYLTCTNLQVSI